MKKLLLVVAILLAFPVGLVAVLGVAAVLAPEDDDWHNNCEYTLRNPNAWFPPDFRQFVCRKEDGTWTAINIYGSEDLKNGDVVISGLNGKHPDDVADSVIDEGPAWIELRLTDEEQDKINGTLADSTDPCYPPGSNPECAE